MYLPEWVQKHKEKYTEIRRINNGFYKYEVSFSYNREKGLCCPTLSLLLQIMIQTISNIRYVLQVFI